MTEAGIQTGGGMEVQPVMPVRRLNNFVYCPRLFYFQWVENVFQESADTVGLAHTSKCRCAFASGGRESEGAWGKPSRRGEAAQLAAGERDIGIGGRDRFGRGRRRWRADCGLQERYGAA